MRIKPLLVAGALLWASFLCAQQPAYKFEKISPELLQRKVYAIDSGASAIILADVGSTEIEGNSKGWFSFVFRRHKRVHILNKNGYDEATFSIPLYHQDSYLEERLDNLKAVAYNLENGKVVETRLSKDQVFTEKKSRHLDLKKFTLPSVREGSIIDVEYKITSDYLYTLQPWDFQGATPRLWSEYNLAVPQFLEYMFIYKGYIPFFVDEKKNSTEQFTVVQPNNFERSDRIQFTAGVTTYRWATRDVPGFRGEAFLTSPSNYLSHMDFQLAAYREPLTYKNLVPSWEQMAEKLLKDENFGQKIDKANYYLGQVMPTLMKGSKLQQAANIYAFVRDQVACNQQTGIYLQQPVREVFESRKGNVAEVNLLLVTMLRYAGIDADPLMISTRSHGSVFTTYPMLTRFNYILVAADIDGRTWHLDASKPRMGFGHLAPECYNGMGRRINERAEPVVLLADSLKEKKATTLFLSTSKSGGWSGILQQTTGNLEAHRIRRTIAENGQSAFFASLQKQIGQQAELSSFAIDSLHQFEYPLGVKADVSIPASGDDMIYLSPMFGMAMHDNPLKTPERTFPVEMPHTIDETFNLTLHVPEGYELEELPKAIRMKLNERNEGSFEYLTSHAEGVISLRSRLKVIQANFSPEEYAVLREFFSMVVGKHQEQIVLKKKK